MFTITGSEKEARIKGSSQWVRVAEWVRVCPCGGDEHFCTEADVYVAGFRPEGSVMMRRLHMVAEVR